MMADPVVFCTRHMFCIPCCFSDAVPGAVVVDAGRKSLTPQIHGLWVLVLASSRRQRPPLAEASIYFRARHSGL